MRTLHPFAIEPSSLLNDMAQHHPDFTLPPSASTTTSATTTTSLGPPSRSPTPVQMPSSNKPPTLTPLSPMNTDSIQPALGASKKPDSVMNGQLPPWTTQPHEAHDDASGHLNAPQASGSKRKLDDQSNEDTHNKIRRVVQGHVTSEHPVPMTTVVCLHAAVAQKSYGSEKRFLCPPPVVHIEGPFWQMRNQQLSMAVVSENGDRSFEQKAPLDNNMTASFKFLHVTGTAKAKSFQLALDISEAPPPTLGPEGADPPSGRIWASFDSAPVTIISKPSKKTAKTRNISSCILAGGPVSLFNRINSQTVRTKYMTIHHAQLCASNVAWSAFNVNVIRRPADPITVGAGPQPVTYGCEVVLTDSHSGISTAPLIIRKVDKGRVSSEEGGPVSQMQKIALQRVNHDGSRHYLSAAGPVPGTPGVVSSPTTAAGSHSGTHPLMFSSPRVTDELKDGVRLISDEVDDYLCWTIVGISKFQYTFFDAFGRNDRVPQIPITPFPTLFTTPVYRAMPHNTLELTVSNFFYEDPETRASMPLDIYLGSLGPLRHRIYQAPPAGPLTTISPFLPAVNPMSLALRPPADDVNHGSSARIRSGPLLHTIVIAQLPALNEVVKALEEDAVIPPALQSNLDEDTSNGIDHDDEAAPASAPPPLSSGDGSESTGDGRNGVEGESSQNPPSTNANATVPAPAATAPPAVPNFAGRSLPLLFVRAADGVGYHSGRTITCDSVMQTLELAGANLDPAWVAAAQAAAMSGEGAWTMRVL